MMFCYKCGKQLEEGTAFCPDCGTAQNREIANPVNAPKETSNPNVPQQIDNTYSTLAIIGFVISLISLVFNPYAVIAIIACVCCGIVNNKLKANGEPVNKLAMAGAIIGAIGVGWGVFVTLMGGF